MGKKILLYSFFSGVFLFVLTLILLCWAFGGWTPLVEIIRNAWENS